MTAECICPKRQRDEVQANMIDPKTSPPIAATDPTWTNLLTQSRPPSGNLALEALWWAEKGDWERAHQCVQADEGNPDCDLVHAHLHRQEGDRANALYWYRRARSPASDLPLAEERRCIATRLLAASSTGE